MRKVAIVTLGMLFLSIGLAAWGEGVDAGGFVRDGVGARAFGLGGAFVAVADDPSTTIWNPAGLGQLEGVNLSGMHTNRFGAGVYFQSVAATARFGAVGIGLSLVRSSIEDIPYTGDDAEGGFFSDVESVFLASVCYDLSGGLLESTGAITGVFVGSSVKYYSHTLLEGKGTGVGMDFGLLMISSHDWGEVSFGLSSQDPGGTAIRWEGTEHNPVNYVPWLNRIGVSVALFDRSLRLAGAVDFAVERSFLNRLRLGTEYWPVEQLGLRAGLALGQDGTQRFSAGVSVRLHEISLDYAYVPHGTLGTSHILSLQFSFAPWWERNGTGE